jgi:hypothetical protein
MAFWQVFAPEKTFVEHDTKGLEGLAKAHVIAKGAIQVVLA